MKNDKQIAQTLEKVAQLETSNLDSKFELLTKFETKFDFFDEKLKLIKNDCVGYTDGRIARLEYGKEQQDFMRYMNEQMPIIENTIKQLQEQEKVNELQTQKTSKILNTHLPELINSKAPLATVDEFTAKVNKDLNQ